MALIDGSAELLARTRVGQDKVELFAKFEAQDKTELLGKFASQATQELFGKFVVGQGSQELFGKFAAQATRDLLGKVGITHSVELFGKVIITHSVELPGKVAITHSVELLGKTIIRHMGIPRELLGKFEAQDKVELYGKADITHSVDLYARTEVCHWEDLGCALIIQHSALTELPTRSIIRHDGTPVELPATFWIRPLYRLWTSRRYLNGVVELNETLIGNAILEYVIEGVMQDIQSYLINCDLDYSDWTDISLTPKLIKRATTYATVAALYARRTKTFTARVIPNIAPVTITVIGDEERAMKHWHDKMNRALEYYVTSQSGDVMLTSTDDEEPVFSMEDIPPVPSAYTPWYQWLMKRET